MTEELRKRSGNQKHHYESDDHNHHHNGLDEQGIEGQRTDTVTDMNKTMQSSTTSLLSNHRLIFFLVLLTTTLFICLRYRSPHEYDEGIVGQNAGNDQIHAVVFDAGSTGTRIHVFQFAKKKKKFGNIEEEHNINKRDDIGNNNGNHAEEEDDDFTVNLVNESFDHVEPGLSAYADDPSRIRPGLQRLLNVALEEIPASKLSSTPVVLKATAGLRLLSLAKAEALLREVRTVLKENGFVLKNPDEDVSILDGVDEGYYGWITVNYLLGRIGGDGNGDEEDKHQKVATMDLGGGSTQITFDLNINNDNNDNINDEVKSSVPPEFVKSIEILGEEAEIYTRSYLGLGIMAARLAILQKGTNKDTMPEEWRNNVDLVSPCLPPWHEDSWTYGGVDYRVKAAPLPPPAASSFFSSSSSDLDAAWTACFSHASSVVASASVDVIPRQIIDNRVFYAFSYYFDRLLEVGLISDGVSGGVVTVNEVVEAASQVCRHFPHDKRPFLCMDLAHIAALLTSPSGLGFQGGDQLFLRKKIAGKEASWSLGSAFSLIE